MDKSDKARVSRFLKELGELSRKHGVRIGGSGDLGSPWVSDAKAKKFTPLVEHLYFCKACGLYGPYADHDEH